MKIKINKKSQRLDFPELLGYLLGFFATAIICGIVCYFFAPLPTTKTEMSVLFVVVFMSVETAFLLAFRPLALMLMGLD